MTAKRKTQPQMNWEKAKSDDYPILAYCVYESSLPVFKSRNSVSSHKKAAFPQKTLVSMLHAQNEEGVIETQKRVKVMVRLPYTRQGLINRKANGRLLPKSIEELIYS